MPYMPHTGQEEVGSNLSLSPWKHIHHRVDSTVAPPWFMACLGREFPLTPKRKAEPSGWWSDRPSATWTVLYPCPDVCSGWTQVFLLLHSPAAGVGSSLPLQSCWSAMWLLETDYAWLKLNEAHDAGLHLHMQGQVWGINYHLPPACHTPHAFFFLPQSVSFRITFLQI